MSVLILQNTHNMRLSILYCLLVISTFFVRKNPYENASEILFADILTSSITLRHCDFISLIFNSCVTFMPSIDVRHMIWTIWSIFYGLNQRFWSFIWNIVMKNVFYSTQFIYPQLRLAAYILC